MEDAHFHSHIDTLAREEHHLFEKEAHGKASEKDQARLKELETLLDQCWDLLRQRRAKREYGKSPEDAAARDPKTIKGYIG